MLRIATAGADESFDLHFREMPEVHKEPKLKPGGAKIILNLSTMFIDQFLDCLKFNDDLIEANQIRHVH